MYSSEIPETWRYVPIILWCTLPEAVEYISLMRHRHTQQLYGLAGIQNLSLVTKGTVCGNVLLPKVCSSGILGGGWVTQYKRPYEECATNMGSKISFLVYEWPLIKCKIWYMNEWVNFSIFFQIMIQNWVKFKNILEKLGWFYLRFGPKLSRLVHEWVNFSWKIGICMGPLSNSVAAHPYQNQTRVSPPRSGIPDNQEIMTVLIWDITCRNMDGRYTNNLKMYPAWGCWIHKSHPWVSWGIHNNYIDWHLIFDRWLSLVTREYGVLEMYF